MKGRKLIACAIRDSVHLREPLTPAATHHAVLLAVGRVARYDIPHFLPAVMHPLDAGLLMLNVRLPLGGAVGPDFLGDLLISRALPR